MELEFENGEIPLSNSELELELNKEKTMKLIPVIATRIPDEIQEQISTGRPLLGSSGIDPTVYENATSTADKVKYLVTLQSNGELEADEVAAKASRECSVSETDIRLVINSFTMMIMDMASEYGSFKCFTPFGILETLVKGSLDSVTDQLDPDENYLYLNITPNDALRKAAESLSFFNASEKSAPFKAEKVIQHETGAEGPFQMGSDVTITGMGYRPGAAVKFIDTVSGTVAQATIVENVQPNYIIATVPNGLDTNHKQKVVVAQTIDGEVYELSANKQGYQVLPAPQPDHEILLVKHGERADNEIAFDETNPVVCTVAHHNGAGYELKAEKPVKVVLDYENQRHVYAVLDTQTIVSATETTVSFMNDENDTEEVDGSFWNHDVELTLYFADGGSATKTVRFVQM